MPRREPLDLPEDDEPPRRRKPSGGVPVWVWALVGVGGLALVGCCGGGLVAFNMLADHGERRAKERAAWDAGQEAPPAKKWEGEPVSADELSREYQNDGPAAVAKYGKNEIHVRMRVDRARVSGTGDMELIHEVNPGNSYPHVVAAVPQSDAGKAKAGSSATVSAVVQYTGQGFVQLKGRVLP